MNYLRSAIETGDKDRAYLALEVVLQSKGTETAIRLCEMLLVREYNRYQELVRELQLMAEPSADSYLVKQMKTTDWLAIYGAVISTLVFLWNVRQSRPKLKIDAVPGIKSDKGGFGIFVIARNQSSRPVHLASISPLVDFTAPSYLERLKFVLKYKRWPRSLGWVHSSFGYYDLSDGCPVIIEPGSSHEMFIPDDKVEEILGNGGSRFFRASAQDKLWNNYYSNALSYQKLEAHA